MFSSFTFAQRQDWNGSRTRIFALVTSLETCLASTEFAACKGEAKVNVWARFGFARQTAAVYKHTNWQSRRLSSWPDQMWWIKYG